MDITLKSGEVSAKIVSKGAELKSLTVGKRELMWSADPAGQDLPASFSDDRHVKGRQNDHQRQGVQNH